MRTESLGGLRVRITGGEDREGGGDGPVVVLMHGFGAPGDDLVPLARVIDVPRATRFVFPEAPAALPGFGEGRAWWMIDQRRLERMTRGEPADMTREVPAGLVEARERVVGLLDEVDRTLRPSRVVVGGFSQGAMLACDVALHTARPLAGLAMLSGTFVAEDEWTPRMEARRGLPAFLSHGTADALLPYAMSEKLRDAMKAAGLNVTWSSFRGGHEIPHGVLEALGGFLRGALA